MPTEHAITGIRVAAFNSKYAPVQKSKEELLAAQLDVLGDIATIAKNNDFAHVVIIGETPSFNDGDICRHSTQVFLDGYNEYLDSGDEDDEDDEDETEDPKPEEEEPVNLEDLDYDDPKAQAERARRAKVLKILERTFPTLEQLFDTNWKIVLRLASNAAFTYTVEDHDAGY